MGKNNKSRFIRILVSVLIAVVVWIYVDTELAPDSTMKVRDIPVEFAGEETTLADRGYMLLSGYDATVDLELEGPRNELYSLDEEGIRVVADTSTISAVGTQSLSYTVYYPDNISRNSISVKGASAYSITVSVGELYTKEVPVYCDVVGEVAGGYIKGDVSIDVSTLTLHAQREDLLNVSYAKVQVSASGAIETIIETINYTLYDYNDVPVENENIRSATKVIQVTLPVRTTKVVPLKLELVGAGDTSDAVSYVVNPETVTLLGEGSTLSAVDSITLDRIYVEDLQLYQTFSYDIKAPLGTSIVGDETTALVTVSVNGASERTLSISNITCVNLPEGFKAVPDSSVSITFWGLQDEIEQLLEEDVQVSADLCEITEAGTYSVPVKIIINGYEDIAAKGTYEVSVTVSTRDTAVGET